MPKETAFKNATLKPLLSNYIFLIFLGCCLVTLKTGYINLAKSVNLKTNDIWSKKSADTSE